jgi:hypothetical protein
MDPDERIIRIEDAVLTIEHIFRAMTDRAHVITMPVGPNGVTLHALCESIRADRAVTGGQSSRPFEQSA